MHPIDLYPIETRSSSFVMSNSQYATADSTTIATPHTLLSIPNQHNPYLIVAHVIPHSCESPFVLPISACNTNASIFSHRHDESFQSLLSSSR